MSGIRVHANGGNSHNVLKPMLGHVRICTVQAEVDRKQCT